jgi:hypothetical protein
MRPTIPSVKIELDKERTLRFDFNALSAFEEQTGLSSLDPTVWRSSNAKTIRAFLWSALIHEDESLTLKSVGAMIHAGNLEYVSKKIRDAAAASSPEPSAEQEGDDGKNAPLPTG